MEHSVAMPLRGIQVPLVRIAVGCGVVLALSPGAARAIPVTILPFEGPPELAEKRRQEVENLFVRALRSDAAARHGFEPADPVVAEFACRAPIKPQCLRKVVETTPLVLTGALKDEAPRVVVSLRFHDSTGSSPPMRLELDPRRADLPALVTVLARTFDEWEGHGARARQPRPKRIDAIDAPTRTDVTPAPEASPASAGMSANALASPIPVDSSLPRGAWITATGGGLLLLGSIAGLVDRAVAEDLSARNATARLTPDDKAGFAAVRVLNVVASVLLVSGGLTAGTVLCFWTTIDAPPDPRRPTVRVGVGGRF